MTASILFEIVFCLNRLVMHQVLHKAGPSLFNMVNFRLILAYVGGMGGVWRKSLICPGKRLSFIQLENRKHLFPGRHFAQYPTRLAHDLK